MSLIDSFWGSSDTRDNPPRRRPRIGKHRASRGGHTVEALELQRLYNEEFEPEGGWSRRTDYVAPHGELGFMPVKASGGRLSAMEWAKANKGKTVVGVATMAGLLAYMARPASASATVAVPPQGIPLPNPVPAADPLGKALGIGAFVAVAAGVALFAAEDK